MNVYDFDGTIYDGDSSVDFYLFCIKKCPTSLASAPTQAKGFLLYALKKIDKTKLKEHFFSYLTNIDDVNLVVQDFWNANECKIKEWYLKQKREDDVIISASPGFLLEPVLASIGVTNLIASDVDIHSGKFASKNCHDKMKPIYFREKYPRATIDNFYSDSLSDEPMAKIAKHAYLVKRNEIVEWSRE